MDAMREAASSIAKGIPSRRRQISTTASRSSDVEKCGATARARSEKSITAEESIPVPTSSEGTGHNCSSMTPKASRLVARIFTVADRGQRTGFDVGQQLLIDRAGAVAGRRVVLGVDDGFPALGPAQCDAVLGLAGDAEAGVVGIAGHAHVDACLGGVPHTGSLYAIGSPAATGCPSGYRWAISEAWPISGQCPHYKCLLQLIHLCL